MKKILSSIILITLSIGINAQPKDWHSAGLGGGGAMFSPSISPHNNQEYYITSDMGGTFHSTDMGNSWDVIPFYELSGAGTNGKVNFSSNASILYSRGFTNYPEPDQPLKSTDGGATWSVLKSDPTAGETFYVVVDPNSTDRVIVTNYSKIFFSANGGQNFVTAYTTADGGGIHVAGVFWDGVNIYVGTNLGLLVSTNSGTSFALENYTDDMPSDFGIISMTGTKVGNTVTLFCVAKDAASIWGGISPVEYESSNSDIYKLSYGSATGWRLKNSGIPAEVMPYHVSMSQNNADIVYMAGYSPLTYAQCVYKSVNGGDSWTSVFQTTNNGNIKTAWMGHGGDLNWGWAGGPLGFTVALNNPDVLLITDWGFAHTSTDGGATWTQVYVPNTESNPGGASTPKKLYYHSNGLEITSVWYLTWMNENDVFASYTDFTGLISHDDGKLWSKDFSYPTNYNTTYQVVKHPDNGRIYAAVSSVHDMYQSTYLEDSRINSGTGEVFYSTNDGDTWSVLYDFGHPVIWIAIDPNNTSHLYASVIHSTEGGIFYSENSGASWTKLTNPPRTEGHPYNINVLNDGTLVCSYSGRRDGSFTLSSGVFVSTNNGLSWSDVSHPDMRRWTHDVVIDPHDTTQNTWYACVYSHWGAYPNEVGGIFRTKNRGTSWQRISNLYRVSSLTIDPENQNIAYVATDDGVHYIENLSSSSPTFKRLEEYHFSQAIRIFYNPYNHNEVWITSLGNGLKKGYQTITSVEENHKLTDKEVMLYPNPASSEFSIDVKGKIKKVIICDIVGKQVLKVNRPNSNIIDISGLSSGVYCVSIQTSEKLITKKLQVNKK